MRARERPGTATGALAALVAAGVGLATAFGVHITAQEHDAILTFTGAIAVAAPLAGALFDHATVQERKGSQAQAAAAQIVGTLASPGKAEAVSTIEARIEELQRQREAMG